MFRKSTPKHDPAPIETPPAPLAGDNLFLSEDGQRRLRDLRSQQELAQARAQTNWWRFTSVIFGLVAGGAILGWHSADIRYENSRQMTWVKMYPNGQTQVEYWDDDGNPNRWHQATINSGLIEWIDHRFRKHKETIASDYGWVLPWMAEDLQKSFVGKGEGDYNAAKVAADYEGSNGARVDTWVRALDHNTVDTPDPNNHLTATVETTAYVQFKHYGASVSTTCENKIVKLLWTLRPVAEIPKDPNNPYLRVDPLGIKLITVKLIDDTAQTGSVKCDF